MKLPYEDVTWLDFNLMPFPNSKTYIHIHFKTALLLSHTLFFFRSAPKFRVWALTNIWRWTYNEHTFLCVMLWHRLQINDLVSLGTWVTFRTHQTESMRMNAISCQFLFTFFFSSMRRHYLWYYYTEGMFYSFEICWPYVFAIAYVFI